MKGRKLKHKEWLDRRSRKIQQNKRKNRKRNFLIIDEEVCKILQIKNKELEAPVNFSLTENSEETMYFFEQLIQEIRKQKIKQEFFIDCSEISMVTIDALIYIIAIAYNIRKNPRMMYTFSGNLPNNEEAKTIFIESGYLRFFNARDIKLKTNSSRMQILSGNRNDPIEAKKVCDFTKEILGEQYKTNILYEMLIELMGNTYHHAYNKEDIMIHKWYIYAESKDEGVEYTFIDTGAGIPQTIYKKIYERLPMAKDSRLIMSALLGESRTETRKSHHGTGLPYLYDNSINGNIRELTVLSGHGKCKLCHNLERNYFVQDEYNNCINGTIYKWKLKRKEC